METKFFNLTVEETLRKLHSSTNGLSSKEVMTRREKDGANVLETKKHSTLLEKFVAQFKDLMIIILMIAALISMLAGEVSDHYFHRRVPERRFWRLSGNKSRKRNRFA